jgi:hypothetical protein
LSEKEVIHDSRTMHTEGPIIPRTTSSMKRVGTGDGTIRLVIDTTDS